MFKKILFIFSINLILSLKIITAQTTTSIYQDYGKCNCDLTLNSCDLNCCCDTSCSTLDLQAFKCATFQLPKSQWCVPNSAIFLQNTPYIISSFGDLVCIDLNNSVSLNYYQAPLTDGLVVKEEYVSIIANMVAPQISTHTFKLPTSQNRFNKNDYIWTILPNNNVQILKLPSQVGSNCRTGPPVYHYQNKNSKCLISSQNIQQECSQTTTTPTTLSLKYFLNEIKFLKDPKSLSNCLNASQTPSTLDLYTCSPSYLTKLNLRSCSLENGVTISLDDCQQNYLQPVLANNLCSRLVKSITYILRFNSSEGIIETGMDVIFQSDKNVQTLSGYVEQTFKVEFIPDTITLSNYDTLNNQKLSGNPGYLRGLPILAGSNDRSQKFTYLMSDSQGACPKNDALRSSIKFNENIVTECSYKPSYDPNLDSFCNLIQTEIDSIILGFALDARANRFAPFGNSDPKNWITIKNSDTSTLTPVSNVNGICRSLRIGTSIQIAYAYVGSVANPQAQIQYISYNWNEIIDLNLKCTGQFCINVNDLSLRISTRVIFVDVSQPPLYTESQISKPRTRLPGADDPERFFIFTRTSNLKYLQNKHIFCDGTFNITPKPFYQVYSIHALVNGQCIVMVYCLLPRKNQKLYERVLSKIKEALEGLPLSFTCGFEKAFINACVKIFPGMNVFGCFFHYKQNLFRKIQELGLVESYNNDEFSSYEMTQFLDYFEATYIGKLVRTKGRYPKLVRNSPIFELDFWNVNQRLSENIPKTNNFVEAWHKSFSSMLISHSLVYALVDAFRIEQKLISNRLLKLNTGVVYRRKPAYDLLNVFKLDDRKTLDN
ncbi:unnamed protein product [Brachionus calyciflorus]|uniref:MULE transposase domain-containing protein n=1 Tax=Brachionus calyciflorus TaxID=104777 RepID=A0A813T9N8_9BILA|nr:unnamed protein product [Brachionus calyciflorus]